MPQQLAQYSRMLTYLPKQIWGSRTGHYPTRTTNATLQHLLAVLALVEHPGNAMRAWHLYGIGWVANEDLKSSPVLEVLQLILQRSRWNERNSSHIYTTR